MIASLLVLGVAVTLLATGCDAEYKIGVGIADITGPPTEIAFMGYGRMGQKGHGLHLRQFSRAFIVDDGNKRFVFVSADCGMVGNGLRQKVIEKLRSKYGNRYTEENVMISGTHTHSTPGGFLQDLLFDLTTLGFVKETFQALLSGITLSVVRADDKVAPGKLRVVSGELLDVSINRSPTAYQFNPEDEIRRYKYDTDKTMTQLQFLSTDGSPLGAVTWYAVHATSMNNTNTLVSSDNLGLAAILFERRMNPGSHPGKGSFVAAFASSNEGDVSPNIKGPRCQISGRPCDARTSTCATKRDACIALGPGRDMFESTRIIGTRLADKAWELWGSSNAQEVTGPVGYIHQFVDMPTQQATIYDEKTRSQYRVKGCIPAMGYSFAAGTTDGPGAFVFQQATTTSNPLWNVFRDFLAEPSPEDVECHKPKPILLATGSMNFPLEWQPRIVSTQMFIVGNQIIASVPGEFTTMSGRRLREAIHMTVVDAGGPQDINVIIAGLSNTYSDYVVTPEEYQVQRYEGASTIFGPHTLTLYIHHYRMLAEKLIMGKRIPPGPEPPELMNDLVELTTPVIFDTPKWNHEFGDVLDEPPSHVRPSEIVRATFVASSPRNNIMHGSTYFSVDRWDGSRWIIVATDAYWETKFVWERTSTVLGTSEITVFWEVPHDVQPGEYRFRLFGYHKRIFGGTDKYTGTTRNFTVSAPAKFRYGSGRRIRAAEWTRDPFSAWR